MVDLKDRAKETASKLAELASDASDMAIEAGKAVAEKGAELAKSGVEVGAEYASSGAEKAIDLAKTAGGDVWEKGQELLSSFRKEEDSEALKLQKEQKTLGDLSPLEQDQYLDALLYLLIPFDPPEKRQLQRIYQILAMMKLNAERRQAFLDQLFLSDVPPDSTGLSPDDEMLRMSLAKDLLALAHNTPSNDLEARLNLLVKGLQLTSDQVKVLNQWTDWENKILAKIGRSDLCVESKDLPVETMKKASAVGVPLAALYMSGSVVGFSAVGLTSGLATIGSAAGLTALGLNPMTAGIAALILGGVAVKKILDATLPTTKSDQDKKLQAGLRVMEARRNRYLAMLGQDLVRFSKNRPRSLTGQSERVYEQAFDSISGLLQAEALVTLGQIEEALEPVSS